MGIQYATTDDLLRDLERKGLSPASLIRTVIYGTLLTWNLISGGTYLQVAAISAFFGIPLLLNIAVIFFLVRKINFRIASHAGLAVDCAVLLLLPLFRGIAVGSFLSPAAQMINVNFTFAAIALTLVCALTLRPLYPLAVSSAGILLHIGLIAWVLHDPSTVLTHSAEETAIPHMLSLPSLIIRMAALVMTGALVTMSCVIARKSIVRIARFRRAYAYFARHFNPRLARKLSRTTGDTLPSGGVSHTVAILYTGLRDFTGICEKNNPDIILDLLARYHECVSEIIFEHGGTIHHMRGDGIISSFGTPEPSESDLDCALESLQKIRSLNDALRESLQAQGLPDTTVYAGLHYASVIAAHTGTKQHPNYSLIGTAIEAAEKIGAACDQTEHDILVSKQVVELTRGAQKYMKIGSFVLKSSGETITFYSIG
jgi:adenylate cyclase